MTSAPAFPWRFTSSTTTKGETMTEQTNIQTEVKQPSHYVYYTVKARNGNDWKRVGAAWPNKDGKGFTIRAEDGMIGLNLVMREPKDRD